MTNNLDILKLDSSKCSFRSILLFLKSTKSESK